MNYERRFVTLYRRQGSGPPSWEKKSKEAKWLSEDALQITEEKKRSEKQRRKGKIFPFDCRVLKNSKERQESLPQ